MQKSVASYNIKVSRSLSAQCQLKKGLENVLNNLSYSGKNNLVLEFLGCSSGQKCFLYGPCDDVTSSDKETDVNQPLNISCNLGYILPTRRKPSRRNKENPTHRKLNTRLPTAIITLN